MDGWLDSADISCKTMLPSKRGSGLMKIKDQLVSLTDLANHNKLLKSPQKIDFLLDKIVALYVPS